MRLASLTKLLLLVGIILILFKLGNSSVLGETWGYTMPRIPESLLESSVGKQLSHDFIKPGDRIVGGREALRGEFPYQVSVQKLSILGTRTHYCGAALVGQCIVTAAHCLEGRSAKDIMVRLGSVLLKGEGGVAQEYRVEKILMHPNYDTKTIANDIGILKVNRPIHYTSAIKAVPLPLFKTEVSGDTQCIVSGWGSQREGGSVSRSLMYATVPTMNDTKCRDFYGESEIRESMLCAGYDEGGVDSCQGDSGGPLVCDGMLMGVVSWGIGCARPRFPGVYTQVGYYTEWIESQDCMKPADATVPTIPGKFFTFNFPFWNSAIATNSNSAKELTSS